MMKMDKKKLYVITGGSALGKSKVLSLLKEKGYPVLQDGAHRIIVEESAKSEGISRNDPGFQLFLAKKQIEAEDKLPNKTCFVDRSILDNFIAYMQRSEKPVDPEIEDLLVRAKYEQQVFVFQMPPKEIYDTQKTFEPFEDFLVIQYLLTKAYMDRGYEIIKVSYKSHQERADFIVDYVEKKLKGK